jgi:DNA helicase II / ATP-dependent DNA helicase PcrA
MNIKLNLAQRDAVETTKGPLLILAGAGAGKTKTITERIVHIIKGGMSPHTILAITFTNKAAQEMRERVRMRLQEEGILRSEYESDFDRPLIKTFHSFGVYVLRKHGSLLGLTRNFIIKDSSDASTLLRQAMKDVGIDPKEKDPALFKNTISRFKSDMADVDTIVSNSTSHTTSLIAKVWRRYEEILQQENSVDFDDLLTKVVVLFKKNPEILSVYQKMFQYIHVDEYQDTNRVQYEICRMLSQAHNNICVVGDADQNIYSWRGANIENILRFEKDFPSAKVVTLEENYRSTHVILSAANNVISKNTIRKDKKLFTKRLGGDDISLVENYDEQSEALFVAKTCADIIEAGENPSEVAVLYRANFQSRVLEEAFLRLSVLGIKFFERKEVKDIISYLRAALVRESTTDLKRVFEFPKRGIGKITMLKIFSGDAASLPKSAYVKVAAVYTLLDEVKALLSDNSLSYVLEYIVRQSGAEEALLNGTDEDRERLENIRELVSVASKYDELDGNAAAELFFEESTLVSDQDTDSNQSGVKLMTVHASKGLEFNSVCIVGLENELFPHIRIGASKQTKEEQEEERRLFYVAITRARKKLYLTYTQVRTIYGNRDLRLPSPFIDDIPNEHLSFTTGEGRIDDVIVYV